MIRRISQSVAVFLSLFAIGCGGGEERAATGTDGSSRPAADSRPVTVRGSDTMVILGQRFAEEYMERNAGTVIQVNGGGSGTGIAALINGTADLAQASRPMKDEEKQNVQKNRGSAVVETPVALDALAVFVHASNPVKELTIEQASAIFRGQHRNWSEVGGKAAPIVLYGRESSSGTYDYFREHVLDKQDFASSVQTLQGTAAIINAVSKDPNGIGYGGIAYAKDVRLVAIRDGASSSAVAPAEASVADGTYPLSRKLFFYTLENAPQRVSRFVQFAVSPEGQQLVSAVGYFPLNTAAVGEASAATGTAAATNAE